MYGFSLVHSASTKSARECVLNSFRYDSNWNNPGSIMLMQRAFGINDEYSCNIVKRHADANYLDLRAEHNKMIARRLCLEGKALRDHGSFLDSCKRFDSAIKFDPLCADAYEGRADVEIQLGKREDAMRDYEEACRLQPGNDSARTEAQLLRTALRFSSASSRFTVTRTNSTASANATAVAASASCARSSSSGNSSSTATTAAAPALSRVNLIGKLQQSLSRDEIARALDTSSSSGSSSESDSNGTGEEDNDSKSSGQSARSSGGGSRKKKRKRDSDKRDRKTKKRKSKHKGKREERKKKKHKHKH
jgi:tetratricopeptide (TPR) repeat protein